MTVFTTCCPYATILPNYIKQLLPEIANIYYIKPTVSLPPIEALKQNSRGQNHITNLVAQEMSDLICRDFIGLIQVSKSEKLLASALNPTATLLKTKFLTPLLSNAFIKTRALLSLNRLSWTIKQASSALELTIIWATASQPCISTEQSLLTIFFHQSQQMKKRGNKKMLPQMTVFQKQQILLVFIIVPVILMRRDLYFASSSPLIYFAFRPSENEFPLKLQISGLVLEAQGPKFKKAVCISPTRPVQQGSASADIMIKQYE